MLSVDLICQWCVFNDYPMFRNLFRKHRDQVNKIILYPSRHHGVVDLEQFARTVFPETWVHPVNIDYGVTDWRQGETEPCLLRSDSEWIWFAEQDFFVRDWNRFFEDAKRLMETSDMFGWWNETNFPYIHPCCLFIKRELLDRTAKDFRAHSEINGADHFAMITHDAKKLNAKITTLQEAGYKEWEDAFHLGGLTYPYQDFKGDDTIIGVKSPEAFAVYNYMSRLAPVKQSPEYAELSKDLEDVLAKKYALDQTIFDKWKEFYL